MVGLLWSLYFKILYDTASKDKLLAILDFGFPRNKESFCLVSLQAIAISLCVQGLINLTVLADPSFGS